METRTIPWLCVAVLSTLFHSRALAQAPFDYEQMHSLGRSNVVGITPGQLTRGIDGRFYGAAATSDAGAGNLYRLDTNGANPEVIHRFAEDGTGSSTQQRLAFARDGKVYGWAHTVGSSSGGALFRLDANGANFQTLLTAAQAQTLVWREMLEGSDDRIYALAGNRIVCVNRDGSGFQNIHTNLSGSNLDQLFEGSDGRLYAVESTGAGLIFRIDKDGSNREIVRDFAASPVPAAATPRTVFEASNGKLYGSLGGIGAIGVAKPKLFEMSRDGSTFAIVRELETFPENGLNFGNVVDSLIEGGDGLLYGSVPHSGLHKAGYAFRVGKDGSGYTNLFEWPAVYVGFDAGANVNRSATKFLVEGADGRIHGTTISIGTGPGVVYRFEHDGSDFETVFTFERPTTQGVSANPALAQGTNGVLYGTARNGGDNNNGTVFSINPDGSDFTVLKTFASTSQGENPAGLTVGSDGAIYGVTEGGGSSGFGTVFAMNPDSSEFRVLRSFLSTGADGRVPVAPLIEGSDGALYGSTTFGGGAAAGTLFKIGKDGSAYTILHRFTNNASGSNVTARLLEGADGRLYGTAVFAGPQGGGTVFALDKAGGNFVVLHSFVGAGGSGLRNPRGALTQGADGTLYGTTTAGGNDGFGGVFRLQTNGSGFQVLREFSSTGGDGRAPEGGVTLGSDGFLYGVTRFGGGAINGSIYRLGTNGSGYEKLRAFTGTGSDGGNPVAGMIRGANGALYGTTSAGGELGFGTLFRIMSGLGLPEISIASIDASTIRLSWPESAAGFQLESNNDVANRSGWLPVTNALALSNGLNSVTLATSNEATFYRLGRP
jgi:uncharacterized repeat protein (TIGR03803 family)